MKLPKPGVAKTAIKPRDPTLFEKYADHPKVQKKVNLAIDDTGESTYLAHFKGPIMVPMPEEVAAAPLLVQEWVREYVKTNGISGEQGIIPLSRDEIISKRRTGSTFISATLAPVTT